MCAVKIKTAYRHYVVKNTDLKLGNDGKHARSTPFCAYRRFVVFKRKDKNTILGFVFYLRRVLPIFYGHSHKEAYYA